MTARVEVKPRRGVVIVVVGNELDIIPGLSDPPPHGDFLRVDNPSRRSGLEHTTYFDLRDVNTVPIDGVEVVGLFPRRLFGELLERLAVLGGVEPE